MNLVINVSEDEVDDDEAKEDVDDDETKEDVANKKALEDALKLVQKYKNEFSRGSPLVCACERGRLEDV